MEGVKNTVWIRILRLLYIAIKVYIKVSKILDETASLRSMLHPKGTRRIFDKEKSNIFSNDFANSKIDTIIEVASFLGVRQ